MMTMGQSTMGHVRVGLLTIGLGVACLSPVMAAAAVSKGSKAGDKARAQAEAQTEPARGKNPATFGWAARQGKAVDTDERADLKRDEAIDKLKQLLPTIGEGPQKAELVFRLSEMYWAKARYISLRAMQQWDKALDAWHEAGSRGPQPKLTEIADHGRGKLYRREALKLYQRILRDYPNYSRKDEVLYNLGSSLYDSGKKRSGVSMYWKLIKQFPRSDYAADAWLQLGEHFFNANKLSQAVKAYGKAAETKKPRIYSYAVYKLAWCDYNLGEYAAALKKFTRVIEHAKAQQRPSGGNTPAGQTGALEAKDRVQLMSEAYSDMVRTYSHLDAVDGAFKFYQSEMGKVKAYSYLLRLARLYDSEGKYEREIEAFDRLNREYPYAPEAPENQSAILEAYAKLNNHDAVRKEVRRLVDLYSPNGPWAQRNASNKRVLEQAFEVVEAKLAQLVTEQHRAAQATKLVATYRLARDIYKEYLGKFDDSINSYQFRFFYAEILYELKQYRLAAEQYSKVVEVKPKGKFAKPAAYTAILAWEKVAAGADSKLGERIARVKRGKAKGVLKKLERLTTLTKGKTYKETALTEVEQKLAAACDRFVEVAPKDSDVVKVKFKSARLYYIHHQFEEAASRFGEIIDRWPNDRLARLGAESIVQSFNVREDWTQLNVWSRKFRDNRKLMRDKTFRKTIYDFVEGASFNEIHFVIEPKGQAQDIADRYAGFVKEFPKSKYAMVALYNAVVYADKANRLEQAMVYAESLLKDFAESKTKSKRKAKKKAKAKAKAKATAAASKKDASKKALPEPALLREKTTFMLAMFHERLAQFEQAATMYETYAANFPKGEKRSDALFNAGVFREGLGAYDAALKNFASYMKDYPKADDVPQLAWRVALIQEKKKDWPKVQALFTKDAETYGKKDPVRALCARFKVTTALLAQGQTTKAKATYPKLVAGYNKLKTKKERQDTCALKAAAMASYSMLEPQHAAYQALKLKGNEKKISRNLVKKLKQVDELQKAYTKVLQIGDGDYGIASLTRVGELYQELAQAIFDTRCPKRLSEDQCAIYEAMLQEKAFPLEEKAIEAYDKAMAKGYELGLYNRWLLKAQQAMQTYEPGRFPQLHTYPLLASETAATAPKLVMAAEATN